MKFRRSYILLFLIPALAGCDIIDEPIVSSGYGYREDLYGPAPTFEPLPSIDRFKRVVIEDFTGHHCGNCPPAHIEASDIVDTYGESKVSVIAVHCTGLADPSEPPYTPDYRTPEGTTYFSPFTGFGIPLGRVNRSGGWDNPWTSGQWADETQAQLALAPAAVMQLEVDFQPDFNQMNVHVNTEYTEGITGTTNLVVLVLESHIVSAQLWYGHVPETVEDYEHNHMLRSALTGPFGLIDVKDPVPGTINNTSYTFDWNPLWLPENCHVLAYLVNNETTEIINSVERNVIE